MAQKTFLIGLYLATNALYRYITRYRVKLEDNATEAQFACILAVLAAIEECLPLIQPPPPVE